MRIQTGTTIRRPAEQVFAVVGDPRNDPRWCPHVRSVRQVAGEGPAPGARYEAVHDPLGKPVDLAYEILAYEPPRRIVLRQDDDLGTFTTTVLLEARGPDETRLTQTSKVRFRSFGRRLLAPVIRRFVIKGNREQFARLQALLERDGRLRTRAW